MKRNIILIFLALTVFAVFFVSRIPRLSKEEQQKRAADYAFLLDSLQKVGYEERFALKESKSMEENLRRLWLKEPSFVDARKNAELLVLLNNFDFIGEGVKKGSSYDKSTDPYYQNWPYDSQYITSSNTVDFSHEEVLWLILLLTDADFQKSQLGLCDVLIERGTEAFRNITNYNIWPYFEKNYPGYLKQMDSTFWKERVSDEMVIAFHNADDGAQNRFMQAVDIKDMQSNCVRPRLVLSFSEAEELIQKFPPEGKWNVGYIRIIEPEITGFGTQQPARTSASIYESLSDSVLAAVTHPADARFAVYEEYTEREYYSTYSRMDGSDDSFDVYIWLLHIRIVDLITGEVIFSETKRGNPPPEEISIMQILRISTVTSDGEYNYDDFDYDRYANIMVEYIN